MRLIDADTLIDYLQMVPIDLGYREVEDIENYVKQMPTIEPERKVGKWIYFPKASSSVTSTAVHLYPVCSECGCEHPIANYCPNCGARMEEGGE